MNLGTHPVAYVENKNGFMDYEDANKSTDYVPHGGFTYLDNAYWNKNDKTEYLGWDYAHCNDYMAYYSQLSIFSNSKCNLKKWTTEEIFEEVKNVINKLIDIKE